MMLFELVSVIMNGRFRCCNLLSTFLADKHFNLTFSSPYTVFCCANEKGRSGINYQNVPKDSKNSQNVKKKKA